MQVYQFINYSEKKSLSGFNGPAIICLDLEDSLVNVFEPEKTAQSRKIHRNKLQALLSETVPQLKIGIRVNAFHSGDLEDDLEALSGFNNIYTLLLPKTESPEMIRDFIRLLEIKNVSCEQIMPIIETKKGMGQLPGIIALKHPKINSIAFGHCDYNLDIGAFPFFHQNSGEYWSWIQHLCSVLKPSGLTLVNSAVLELNNFNLLTQVVESLTVLCGQNFGQFTMTAKQTAHCIELIGKARAVFGKFKDRLDLKTNISTAQKLIAGFEAIRSGKSFAVTGEQELLISPHEYYAAKTFLQTADWPGLNFTFVGGCFPVQRNILFEDLFHQQLKQQTETAHNTRLNITIIRYELLRSCFGKIKSYTANNAVDALVFCIRPEPMLRLTKAYYKYQDKSGKTRRVLNFMLQSKPASEKFDLLWTQAEYQPAVSETKKNFNLFRNLNYITGLLLGNYRVAKYRYLHIVNEAIRFCNENNIHCMVMGPAINANSKLEEYLSRRFDTFMQKSFSDKKDLFFTASMQQKNGKALFFPGGIYANELYHELIKDEIYSRLAGPIEKSRITAKNNEDIILL